MSPSCEYSSCPQGAETEGRILATPFPNCSWKLVQSRKESLVPLLPCEMRAFCYVCPLHVLLHVSGGGCLMLLQFAASWLVPPLCCGWVSVG